MASTYKIIARGSISVTDVLSAVSSGLADCAAGVKATISAIDMVVGEPMPLAVADLG